MTDTETQIALCGNTTLGLFDDPLGPCVREQDHTHLFHRDERGTEWRRSVRHRFTAGKIYPPWTLDQVTTLNDYQRGDVWHPFTCGNYDCEALLVAHTDGWQCGTGCGYTQNWAHAFMANRDTWNLHRFTARPVSAEEERIATERSVKMAAEHEKSAEWFRAHSGGPSVTDMLSYTEVPAELLSQRETPYGPREDFTVEAYEGGIWAPVRFKISTIGNARLFRDNNRHRFPDGTRMRIVQWTETSSIAETDEETT